MNRLFTIANLFDGDYDYIQNKIKFSRARFLYNYFNQYACYLFFISHSLTFIFPHLKYDLVGYRINDGLV